MYNAVIVKKYITTILIFKETFEKKKKVEYREISTFECCIDESRK